MAIRQRIFSAAAPVICSLCGLLGASTHAAEAPEQYQVKFETTAGEFTVDVHRDWAPRGADRFYELVKSGYYDDARFFRVVPGFVVQFGMAADPKLTEKWKGQPIQDDPVKESNKRGYITFATSGPNSRTSQVFINYGDNSRLDEMGFAPFGVVTGEGMQVVDKIYSEYGQEPSQLLIGRQGNEYLKREFPKLDSIKKATIVEKK